MPFERLKETYTGNLDIGNFLTSIVVTNLMRIVGMVARAAVIISGIVTIIIFIVGGLLGFIVWLFLPLIIIALIIINLIALIR